MKKAIVSTNVNIPDSSKDMVEFHRSNGATHLMLVTDTFRYEDYHVAIKPGEDLDERYNEYDDVNMQRIKWCIKL